MIYTDCCPCCKKLFPLPDDAISPEDSRAEYFATEWDATCKSCKSQIGAEERDEESFANSSANI